VRSLSVGHCAFCGQLGPLCSSHAIPDGAFRVIRNSSRSLIEIVDDPFTENRNTQASWQAPLLCAQCELHFARTWDEFGVKALQGKLPPVDGRPARRPAVSARGVTFRDFDQSRLADFFISVLWRASLLRYERYDNIRLSSRMNKTLQLYLKGVQLPLARPPTVILWKMVDETEGGFERSTLRHVLSAPWLKQTSYGPAACFLFLGFVAAVMPIGLPTDVTEEGRVGREFGELFVPAISPFEVPVLANTMVSAFHKEQIGLTRLRPVDDT
jgi:hypothetical protein